MEKNGKKTTLIVENGVKERHGNMAYYNKTTEKTSIDGKIAGMDVTSAVLTSKELGLYQSYNPTGFAPVTNQVREFDWGTKSQELIKDLKTGGAVALGVVGGVALVYGAAIALPILAGILSTEVMVGATGAASAYVISKISDTGNGGTQ